MTTPLSCRTFFVAAAAIVSWSCADNLTAPAEKGALYVSVEILGPDADDDGFTVTIDSGQLRVVDRFITHVADSATAGEHVVALGGIADNCTINGDNPRKVVVESKGTTSITFSVKCEYTGIRLTTTTTGIDVPPAYSFAIDDVPNIIASNGSAIVSRLKPGKHTATLGGVSANCTPSDEMPTSVDVSNRMLTEISLRFNCTRSGNRIAFVLDSSTRDGGGYVMITNADGYGSFPVVAGYSPSWSPDGTRIVYSDANCYDYYGYTCTGSLLLVDVAARLPMRLANTERGFEPAWSPDGSAIAFARMPLQGGLTENLELMFLDGSPPLTMSIPGLNASHPSWSPDGQRIVFGCTTTDYYVANICVINRDGTGFAQLTNDNTGYVTPSWSPDGSLIAFATAPYSSERVIGLMAADGSSKRRLTNGYEPTWSPDGSTILFDGGSGLFTISPDGSNKKRITSGRHHSPSWRR